MGVPVVIGGDNLPSLVGIGLTDLRNIGGPVAPMAPRFRHHFSGAAALLSSLSSCLCRSSRAKLKRPKIIISDVELNKCMFYKRSTVSNTNAKRVVVDIAPSHLRPNQGP